MDLELERKWTVSKDIIKKYNFNLKYKIQQGYLIVDDNKEIRIRSKNNIDNDKDKEFYLQRKIRSDKNTTEETSIDLSKNSGEKLIKKAKPLIYKNRYKLEKPYQLLGLDEIKEVIIDRYIKPEVNYNKLEIEFTNKKAMEDFISPIWFGEELNFNDSDLWLNIKKDKLKLPKGVK